MKASGSGAEASSFRRKRSNLRCMWYIAAGGAFHTASPYERSQRPAASPLRTCDRGIRAYKR